MANDSVITQQKLKEYHETYVYPFLNGISTKGDQAFVPCGKIEGFMRTTAPKGYLVCDGTEYLKSAYPSLAALLASVDTAQSTTNFAGSDSDHFKVPDLRGEFLRGTGTNSHSNQGSGSTVGSHQDATEIASINTSGNNKISIRKDSSLDWGIQNQDSNTNVVTGNTISATATSSSLSNAFAYNTTRPTNTSVLYCIAYQDLYLTPQHTYSTTEQVVGTWSGKPLYEKTYEITTPFTITSNTLTPQILESDVVKELVNANGISITSDSIRFACPCSQINENNDSGYWACTFDQRPNGDIRMVFRCMTTVSLTFNKVVATVQYTKTTD